MELKKESYIYLTTNKINNKTYVGQRKLKNKTLNEDTYLGSGKIILRAVEKYGKENFTKEILIFGNFSKKQLDELEIFYISYYKFFNKAEYNISRGGNGGNLGDNVNKILSIKNKERMKDINIRNKISNSLKGRKLNKERNKKVSETHRGMRWIHNKKYETQISKESKLPNGFEYGRLHKKPKRKLLTHEERSQIISSALSGEKNPRALKIHCLELNIDFLYIKQAVHYLMDNNIINKNISTSGPTSCISDCCKGNSETAFGYHWKFI
jgi:group I intron endonuclease